MVKWSQSYLYTLKETPADAEIPSHQLMVRGGFIRKLAPGIYTLGPMALRSVRKFEQIVREELNKRGCLELLMPMVQPRELWDETGRWQLMGPDLLKFKNRNDHEWCLGATHEEVITDYVRRDIKSYRDLPFILYQIQTKYRDEIRPRFGLMRGREFIMKDAYSFDLDVEGALKSYALMHDAYCAIFDRLGVDFRVVNADSGAIGGNKSQEFHILAGSGEDQLLISEEGDYAANVEVCPAMDRPTASPEEALKPVEEFATPGLRTIAQLAEAIDAPEHQLVKTMFVATASPSEGRGASIEELKPVAILLRGKDELNLIKVKNTFCMKQEPLLLTDEEVRVVTGADPGSCGPVGLSIPVYLDTGVQGLKNYIVGANKNGFHLRHVNHGRDFKVTGVADLRQAREGDLNPVGQGVLKAVRGIEVGHIFYLGRKYSESMKAQYLDAQGKLTPIEMGCYGIGITRVVQAVVEQNHDQDGIIWPLAIAPFAVHLCVLDPKDERVRTVSEDIARAFEEQGLECFMDDRDERPGVKFKDADLLGMPVRLNIGGRSLANNEIEWLLRKDKQVRKVPVEKVVDEVVQWAKTQIR